MSKIGLVLGGGGVTGAAHQIATLLAIEAATGWNSDDAEVVIGTSGGAVVSAMVRGPGLSIDVVVGEAEGVHDYAARLRSILFRRGWPRHLRSWARHGLLRGIRHPGLNFALGVPAPFRVDGIADWIEADFQPKTPWPAKPTVIVTYDLERGHRVAFGTEEAPDASLADAVAASCAVPLVYQPHLINGRLHLDGGVASGTSADLVLGNPDPLDLVIVIAPMALPQARPNRHFYEPLIDRAGSAALDDELERITSIWPHCETLVLTPSPTELEEMRDNPMSPDGAIPSFFHTLRSLRSGLAAPEVWGVLQRHLLRRVA
ncbi:MAG: patatin-like phospholipase family protein [Acidimicrobiia bacterium]|nr:patatin-like phospholipase family protein [Acidimicrobiia bacterium]